MFRHSNHGWIGLDIGASTIKLAQVVRRGDRLRLEEAAIVPRQIPLGDEESQVDTAPVSSADELASALASVPQVAGRASAAILPTAVCEFNSASQISGSEAAQIGAIAQELGTLGIDLSHRVFDYWPGFATEAAKSTVNILSTSRAWSNSVTSDLAQAGLNCQTIDGLPQSLARAVSQVEDSRSSLVGAIDWGHTGATFVLIENGQPVYVRQLKNTPFAAAQRLVTEQLDLQAYEASELLRSIHLAPPPGTPKDEVTEVVEEILEPYLRSVISETKRTLEHLQNIGRTLVPKRHVFAPHRIYLFGGGATLGGIDKYLAGKLNREVRIWSLDGSSSPSVASLGAQAAACLFGPAIALSALKWSLGERGAAQ